MPLGPFQICLKICRNIHSSRCTTGVVADTRGKFTVKLVSLIYKWQIATGVIDTGHKFDTGGKFDTSGKFDTGSNFAAGIIDSGGKFTKMGTNVFFNSQIANPQTLGLNLQSQIRKFLRYASSQISNLHIYFD
jgi:hypothetical protein